MQMQVQKIIALLACSALLSGCFQNKNLQSELSITIKDLTEPTITLKQKSYTITEGDSFKIDDCYSVTDNITKDPSVSIDKGGFDNKKVGDYTIKITATDESGNSVSDSFTVEVKEKPKPTPAPTPEATPEVKKNNKATSSNSNSASSNSSSQQNVTVPTVPQEQTETNKDSEETYSEPVTKTDGPYEDANACQSAARSHGALSYKCYDQNGQTYLEWEE